MATLILEVIVVAIKLILKLLSLDWTFLKNNNDKIDHDRIVNWIEKTKGIIEKNKKDVIESENNFINGLNKLLLARYEEYKLYIVKNLDNETITTMPIEKDYMGINYRYKLLTEEKKQEIILMIGNKEHSNLDKAIIISKILISIDKIN